MKFVMLYVHPHLNHRISKVDNSEKPYESAEMRNVVFSYSSGRIYSEQERSKWIKEKNNRIEHDSDGKETKVTDVHVKRWVVEMNSAEDFINLQNYVDAPIIIQHEERYNLPSITIYNGYIE